MKSLKHLAVAVAASFVALSAQAAAPRPAPLAQPTTLTVGYQKVGHLVPMVQIASR